MTTVKLPRYPRPTGTEVNAQGTAQILVGSAANLVCRMMFFEHQGDYEQGHTHSYDHFTLLAAGTLRVTVEGVSTDYVAPYMIFIAREKEHRLEALEEATAAYCIHALRSADPDLGGAIVDPSMIPEGVRGLQRLHSFIPGISLGDEL